MGELLKITKKLLNSMVIVVSWCMNVKTTQIIHSVDSLLHKYSVSFIFKIQFCFQGRLDGFIKSSPVTLSLNSS